MAAAPISLTEEESLTWLALRLVPGLGTRRIGQLLERFRTPKAIFRADLAELEASGLSAAVARSITIGVSFEEAATQHQKVRES
ncbi:MAG TPA: DNA-protecting protein DprA, partial [Bryobacteraceae bacterium]|nr:DNA-protecting protein DprA [Bryobacteraceae bacterium]